MQNLPSQVNIGTGSVSAARRLLLMFSPCWSYQALSHDWAPNCCRSKTFFKMRTAAGCAEAQASLEVHGSIKHCSLFLKSLFSGLGGGSPKMYAASPTPPGEACLPERDFGSPRDQGAQNCQGTAGALLLSLLSCVCPCLCAGLVSAHRWQGSVWEPLGADEACQGPMDGGARTSHYIQPLDLRM